jgi:cytochrome oxidase Cu insertion factor (SCO1/SenC/PrrC family)
MILASVILAASQAAAPERPNPMDLGPSIGQHLIAFEAKDQNGARRSLDSLRGPNGLVLVFFRSADW